MGTFPKAIDLSAEAEARLLGEARAMHNAGYSWLRISKHLGIGIEWMKRRLVPGFAKHENLRTAARYRTRIDSKVCRKPIPRPDDTRDLTGRLLGDPLPGRSALDRQRQA